jgi:tetratricopeptide (TPR) repeat protein
LQAGDLIANRYRVLRLIGRGGMAVVYEAADAVKGTRIALKLLAPTGENVKHASALFQREYETLAQLSHPLIVRAYDYGLDGEVPYYTMELISGETLRQIAPLGWQPACALIRDVASALAIVHSRRLVHRDITPRNVCRSGDGRAKVLDFGALAPMGPNREIVGTPSFIPPEAVEVQPLDGRADLFALGALAYFVLTGRQAYAAKELRNLPDAWSKSVLPPSALASDVPPELEDLILSLLSLNRAARPASAAEVFERLTSIAGLSAAESPDVAQAYLSTPALVARDDALARFRRHLARLRRGRGAALLVEGESGVGRSRLLGAFFLEAKLAGLVTLRAEGSDAFGEPFFVVKVLARELSNHDPELVKIAVEEAGNDSRMLFDDSALKDLEPGRWPPVMAAVANFILSVAKRTPLVIAIDDVSECDEPSLAVLTELCRSVGSAPLEVIVTAPSGSSRPALRELRAATGTLKLSGFRAERTLELASLLFGDVANLKSTADWVHRLSAGNPRTILDLTQHLVNQNVARYAEGRWSLPPSLDGLGLPENLEQAQQAKISGLSAPARALAEVLALQTEQDPLTIDEYRELWRGRNLGSLFGALNELVSASVLVDAGATYVFASRELAESVRRGIPAERRKDIHRELATAYGAAQIEQDPALVAYHLHLAGDDAAAFQLAAGAVAGRTNDIKRGSATVRSRRGARLFESLFVWGSEHGARRADLALIGRNVLQLASVTDVELARHADAILAPLKKECGLSHYDEFSDAADAAERIQRCLGTAFMEYEMTAEAERGLHPIKAIEELAISAGLLIGIYARELEPEKASELLALLTPLRLLSPAMDVIADLVSYSNGGLRGQLTRDQRLSVIERVSQPVPGLDELTRTGVKILSLYYIALEEAAQGYEAALDRVLPLDDHPQFAPLAWQVRMVAHLFRGEDQKAESARRKRDAAMVGRFDIDQHLDLSVLYEAAAHNYAGDLLGLKENLAVIESRAERSPGWRPFAELYRGDYHALRGDLPKALAHLESALVLVPEPSAHSAWSYIVNHLAVALVDVGNAERAHELMTRAIAACEGYPLASLWRLQLETSLALAEAALGRAEQALARARKAVETTEQNGTVGVALVDQYAREAKVALLAGNRPVFEAAARRIEAICMKSESTAFAAKHAGLIRMAERPRGFAAVAATPELLVLSGDSHTTMASGIRTALELCGGANERARHALGVLIDWAAAEEGFLYLVRADGLIFAASSSGEEPPTTLDASVTEWVRASSGEEQTLTASHDVDVDTKDAADFDLVGIVAERGVESLLTGVVALRHRNAVLRSLPRSILNALGEGLLSSGDAVGVAVG